MAFPHLQLCCHLVGCLVKVEATWAHVAGMEPCRFFTHNQVVYKGCAEGSLTPYTSTSETWGLDLFQQVQEAGVTGQGSTEII